jgi:hypothetical protein
LNDAPTIVTAVLLTGMVLVLGELARVLVMG